MCRDGAFNPLEGGGERHPRAGGVEAHVALAARTEVLALVERDFGLLQEEVREDIVKQFKQFGFTYVTMDLTGYRMGSMNETLDKKN